MGKKKTNTQAWMIWGSGNRCIDFLKTANTRKHTIFFCQQEREIEFDFDYSQLGTVKSGDIVFGSYDKDFYYRTTNIGEAKNITLHVWPNYFLYHALGYADPNLPTASFEPIALFTCLNHQPHGHRVMMVDMLAKHKLLKKNFYSWHFALNTDEYIPRYWDGNISHVDGKFVGQQNRFPDVMYRSVIDLITESTTNAPFITEKTFNAILFKKPFMILGYPGIHKELERQGFRLPRNVINYNFDNEPDDLKRAEMIALELKRLSKLNLSNLQKSLRPTVDYNSKHALKVVKRQEGIPQIFFDYKYYKEYLEDIQCKLDLLASENSACPVPKQWQQKGTK